ncbi:lipase family protein [Nocardia pseudobrasiliensis]|uniref:lipase family protein n=1 Tax=Nocardia pseudobrasiliensis TaxID=45979 RepID=UPI000E0C9696|nr:lipase family protein [Nocardia pseudobrasiliensis]
MAFTVVATLLLGLTTTLSATATAAPPLPQNDSFYTDPPGYENAEPGTILRSRPVRIAALNLLPVRVQAWQLLYRTTDFDNKPYTSVTTVMIPEGATGPRPLLSYQTAVDAIAGMCRASYQLQQSAPIDLTDPAGPITSGNPAAEILLAATGLAKGWAVAIPDQGGRENRFATPREPGYVVLDGVRAAERFAPLGLAGESTPVSLWGYSGGGIATAWTAEMQPEYAPELNIVGAAIGAPVADLKAGLLAANGGLLGGLIPIAVAAIAKDSPEFRAVLERSVTPEGLALIDHAADRCTTQAVLDTSLYELVHHLSLPDFTHYVRVPFAELLADPVVARTVEERTLGRRTPTAPVYLYNSVSDEISTITGADGLADAYCTHGASITYRRDLFPPLISPHGNFAVLGAPDALAWLTDRMNGQPAQQGCDYRTPPSTLLDAGALNNLGFGAGAVLTTLLGLPVGR